MGANATHGYYALVITVVMLSVIVAVVTAVRQSRQKKRGARAVRETAAQREERMRVRYAEFGSRWREWNEQPRGQEDEERLVTAASLWGRPEARSPFPRRFHYGQLGQVTLDKRSYQELLDTPVDVADPRRSLMPNTWADLRLDVWALHPKAAQKPRLMRVWLTKERAVVELHRTRVVKVDEILPSEVLGYVRGFTRLGPRSGEVDGLRWLPAEAMELGKKPLWNTFRALRDIAHVAPEGLPVAQALRDVNYHALAFVTSSRARGWDEPRAHLRILDCAGVTYQVGDAFREVSDGGRFAPPGRAGRASSQMETSRGAASPRRGRGRSRGNCPGVEWDEGQASRLRSRGDRRHGGDRVGRDEVSWPDRVKWSDLAVVPVDAREVLWVVERMIEL